MLDLIKNTSIDEIEKVNKKISSVVTYTPTLKNEILSDKFKCNVYLKREDLQPVRSYKIRGAYNKISSLGKGELKKGIVCASAGNHSQGFALSCSILKVKGYIFMPLTTPLQKLNKVKSIGKKFVEIILKGDTFDDSYIEASKFCKEKNKTFIHPFDDEDIIKGQATATLEIIKEIKKDIDYIFIPVGGGGLISGSCIVIDKLSPKTKIIGVEPKGAAGMKLSIRKGEVTELKKINHFCEGAAVKKVGKLNFEICKNSKNIEDIVLVDEGKTCSTILDFYNQQGIIIEPSGALSISALDNFRSKIKNKNVVCILSGGNNDIVRMEEIKEKSLLYEGVKHYFILKFPQRPGVLKKFVFDILGPNDDITHFEYSKKTNRTFGYALVGILLKNKKDISKIIKKLEENGLLGEYLNNKPHLFEYLI